MTIRATIVATLTFFLSVGCQELPTAPEPFEENPQEPPAELTVPEDAIVLHNNGTEAGYLLVSNTEDELYFDFELFDAEGEINEVQLHVASSAEELPRNASDNPVPGRFEHTFEEVNPDETKLSAALEDDYEVGEEVVIAVHASSMLSGEEEALWAGEDRFRTDKKGGNWATHFTYEIQEPVVVDCEEDGVWMYAGTKERASYESSTALANEEGANTASNSQASFIEGAPDGDSFNFDGEYGFGEYGTLEISGSKLTITAAPGYYVHHVKYKNASNTNPGGFSRKRPNPQTRPGKVEITLGDDVEKHLSVEAMFKPDACE